MCDQEDDEFDEFTIEDALGLEPESSLVDPSPFIKHAEMIRWCGPSECERTNDGYAVRHHLQAEYVVCVTANKYLSTRADPSFLGNFFFDTATTDKGSLNIPMGTYQPKIICPVEDFVITQPQLELHRICAT